MEKTIKALITALFCLLTACGVDHKSLRTNRVIEDSPSGRNLDGVPATQLNWKMSCSDIVPQFDADSGKISGQGSLQMPADGPRRVALKFAGESCPPPAVYRGRDVVIAFELSDEMAVADPVATDGSCFRSRMLRQWAAQSEALGLDALDGDVRFSVVLYSRIVLAKVAGFYPTFETVVQRLLSTQKKADLDSMICLGRGDGNLEPLKDQVEQLKTNFGRENASKEFVLVGQAPDNSESEMPESLKELGEAGWVVSGVSFNEGLPKWTSDFHDHLNAPTWSALGKDGTGLSTALTSTLKNRLEWQFYSRKLSRPSPDWTNSPLILSPEQYWEVGAIGIDDSGDNWGLEAQLRAIDRFGIAKTVFPAFFLW